MLEWFDLTNVEVKPTEKSATQDIQSDESPLFKEAFGDAPYNGPFV